MGAQPDHSVDLTRCRARGCLQGNDLGFDPFGMGQQRGSIGGQRGARLAPVEQGET